MNELTTATRSLHMVQMWLDARRLAELARALHLPMRQASSGYLVHCALGELFGSRAPGPFSLEGDDGRYLRVLAYAAAPRDELQAAAREYASPLVYEIPDWPRMASKPMPDPLAEGQILDFQLHACPVVRKASVGRHHAKGREVDVFLHRVWAIDDSSVPIRREDVYRDWLADQFQRRGGARLRTARLERFSLERMLRRTHGEGRKGVVIKRPAATFSGTLQVSEPDAFHEMLRTGIGRHRSFGFGMLKVRPPRR